MADRRRKVLYVAHNHPMFRPGGAEQYALDLYRAMSGSADFEPLLLARAGPPVARSKLLHAGPPVAAANGDPNQYLIFTDVENYDYLNNELAGKPVLTRFLHDFLVAQQPDVVHFHHTLYYGYDVLRVTRNALPRAPIVYTLHDYMAICHRDGQMVKAAGNQMCLDPSPLDCSECFPHAGTQKFFMRKRFIQSHLALVDRFVAPTATTKERFVEWGIPAEKIMVEPYGSSPPARAATNGSVSGSSNGNHAARKRNRFAFFGQLTPYKGADVLLEAMRILGPDFDGHLWLFGANLDLMDERFQARLRKLLDSTNATVTVAGQYDHGDVLELMEDMDWIMVPSIWAETGPFVVWEALHARRPVICSPLGGLAEKVRHGENGLYFRRNDPQNLAALMREAAADPALWQELHDQITPPYAMDSHLQVMRAAYRDLIEGREMSATVERAVRLGEEVTLLACRAADTDDAPPPVPGRQDHEVLCIRCEDLLLLAVAIPVDSTELEIATGAAAVKTFARDYLAPAGAATRDRIVEALSQTMRWQDPHPLSLAESLRLLRDGLRESAIGARDRNDGAALTAEYVALVDRDHLYVRGWLRDPDGAVIGLTAIAPEGGRVSLLNGAYRYSRPDVGGRSALGRRTKNGFIASRRLPAPSLLAEGWLFEVEIAGEPTIEVPAPKVATDALAIRDTVLEDAFTGYLPSDDLMREHVSPAVNRIQDLIQAEAEVESVIQLGEPPADPSVSIVIPLYQHLDHLKFQLSQFADDADMAGADLIYVLDSPDQVEELGEAVRQLFPIYRVPLRVCITGANLGFAGASNAGASIARSDLLLMMNSDVLPDAPGWLSRLTEFYRDTPGCDVLGPKLLHEDGSIQHAGMYLQRFPGSDVWRDAHYFKGLARTFPGANEPRPVPAVSGACLMVDRALFEDLGGFPGCYVRGDYEDYDLCVRAFTRGHASWYCPAVELFHLEAQSYGSELRIPASRYNAWLHTHMWGDEIGRLMSRFTVEAGSQDPAWEEVRP